uniref:BTB domain-containing protein n=2 Tax=Meloidogyne enterolobii TaxID=390850 RepID=A0A6V7XHL8_MELEN|nr:unnamed protein product [Meloidogyne enterolobii]CAD2198768.1 unnamed protein product [Meloidogyne enterolobii]
MMQFRVPPCRLSEDMSNLFEKSLFADCTLYSGNREFQVHKAVLACRSPVFAAMFEHGMAESLSDCVNIKDIDSEVLGEMLRFMYTGSAPNLERMADELLAAADKYQLERLKVMCEQSLCLSLTNETACETLILADLHSAEHLKTQSTEFINLHANEVMETEGWKVLVKEHPPLLEQVFKALATQQTPPIILNQPPRKRPRQY